MSWTAAIPQIFYDIIGRVIPGSTLLLLYYYVMKGHTEFFSMITLDLRPSLAILCIFILAAYILGLLLGGVWFFIRSIWPKWAGEFFLPNSSKLVENLEQIRDPFRTRNNSDRFKSVNLVGFIYDYIHLWRPGAGSRIAKLSAEEHMCSTLFLGLIGLAILNLFTGELPKISSLYFSLAAVAALLIYTHLLKRFATAMKDHWALTEFDEFADQDSE